MASSGESADEARHRRESQMSTLPDLVFPFLPLSVQAITLPALSKAWKKWAIKERAKERALEQAERQRMETYSNFANTNLIFFYVPLWAAQRHWNKWLWHCNKWRFAVRAVAHGDVGALPGRVSSAAAASPTASIFAYMPLCTGSCRRCSGCASAAAPGTTRRARRRRAAATSLCCSGRVPTAASGTLSRA